MLCSNPYGSYGCGQCLPCKINRRRLWTGRLLLEQQLHGDSVFATLTFSNPCPWSLDRRHMPAFMKRLRDRIPRPLRYFGVGEYGEQSWRPHYHLALFGVSLMEAQQVRECWEPWGFVDVGELNMHSAQYVCGYTVKKMTASTDVRLEGRHPEFAQMSLRPGIGKGAVEKFAVAAVSEGGASGLARAGDVPTEFRIDGKKYPLGRYLRSHFRMEVGWSDKMPVRQKLMMSQALANMTDLEVRRGERRRRAQAKSAAARVEIQLSRRQKL